MGGVQLRRRVGGFGCGINPIVLHVLNKEMKYLKCEAAVCECPSVWVRVWVGT